MRTLLSSIVRLALAVAALVATPALGESAPKADAPAGKSDQPKAGEQGRELGPGGIPINPADRLEPTDFYVHKWIATPAFAATQLPDGGTRTVAPVKGRAQVILFLGSWDEGSQRLVAEFERLASRYRRLTADFVYVFVSDTRDDATAFMKEYNLAEGYLANHEVRAAFHNTDLPTIYVGDRRGWLTTRYIKADRDALASLDAFLERTTAF